MLAPNQIKQDTKPFAPLIEAMMSFDPQVMGIMHSTVDTMDEGLKALARVASGGETSRLMLAIKGALRSASVVPTLVFDEIDSGIGGRVGEVVGRKLWSLGAQNQVLCVTHLPQIAAYADSHFRVDKAVLMGRTYAQALPVDGDVRVEELAAMLGGAPSPQLDAAARQLVQRAKDHKQAGLKAS